MEEEKELHQQDWYAILNCSHSAGKEEIEKSARKLFLKYHPDKTSDPRAPEQFLLVQKAKEILLDEAKRKIIDSHITKLEKRKQYESKRNDNMDRERKRMKEELAERMNAAAKGSQVMTEEEKVKLDAALRKKKIIELREKNAARVEKSVEESNIKMHQREEEIQKIKKQSYTADSSSSLRHIKVKWKRDMMQTTESLVEIFAKYGVVEAVEMSQNKGSSAVLVFSHAESAVLAVEAFLMSQDFRVSQLSSSGGPGAFPFFPTAAAAAATASSSSSSSSSAPVEQRPSVPSASVETILSKEADILKKMLEMKVRKKKTATGAGGGVEEEKKEKEHDDADVGADAEEKMKKEDEKIDTDPPPQPPAAMKCYKKAMHNFRRIKEENIYEEIKHCAIWAGPGRAGSDAVSAVQTKSDAKNNPPPSGHPSAKSHRRVIKFPPR
eukprot:gene25001-33505_t